MKIDIKEKDALDYHEFDIPGKIEVVPTKMLSSQLDLALAYSPGVAVPCKEIEKNPEDVYKYTAKGNLVAVISNGTAVLGLGDIGAAAGKPVMEGKGVLFKKFAGIDVFDIEIDEKDPDKLIEIVKSLEPTFGGINLEDIKAPESFQVETELKEKMNIPVMHDDQHGTAIISAAALINALEIVDKKIDEVKIVVNGAGASAVSCSKLYIALGANPENLFMLDSRGVLNKKRTNLPPSKEHFVRDTECETLGEMVKDADVFIGLSTADVFKPEHLLSMGSNPIVFAMANPNPEIKYELAMETRDDIIMGTGRSDHPNQVNNVLGFPFIFRGALDVRSTAINEEMKHAAVYALAELTREPVPEIVKRAYHDKNLEFGKLYLIPKPLDPRLITRVSSAVAKAAMDTGVAKKPIEDWEKYHQELQSRLGIDQKLMSGVISRAKNEPKRVIFTAGDNYKVVKAAEILKREGIAFPILLGDKKKIKKICDEFHLDMNGCEVYDMNEAQTQELIKGYAQKLYEMRQRKGFSYEECLILMQSRDYLGNMLLHDGIGDALVSGITKEYAKSVKPALQIIGVADGYEKVSSMFVISHRHKNYFFADTTIQAEPSAEDMVEIIDLTAQSVRLLHQEPHIAVLSYSNFGNAKGKVPKKARKAVKLARDKFPDMIIDGDIQANVALNNQIQEEMYPFSKLVETGANTFIFPDLQSGNIAYKLLMEVGGAHGIGPILMGMKKPVHILQLGSSIREIVNIASIAVIHSQILNKSIK
ncbi:MAG: NADP-dependent malic enzyme [Bacteroidota bacterium]